jgi:hypothetical protein
LGSTDKTISTRSSRPYSSGDANFVSPSQYSAQLRTWGLRTYRPKGAAPRNSRRGESSILPQSRTETTMSSPAREADPEQDILRLGVQLLPQDRSPSPRPTCVLFRPSLESVEENRVSDDQPGVGFQGGYFGHRPSNETSPPGREVDSPMNLERSLPPPQASESPRSSANIYPHSAASGTAQDAVRRVVQTLSEVLEDHVLKEFFDNLTDTELNGLLTNHVKLERTCHDAFVQHAKRIRRVWGESFALVEIVRAKFQQLNTLLAYRLCSATLLKDGLDLSTAGLHRLLLSVTANLLKPRLVRVSSILRLLTTVTAWTEQLMYRFTTRILKYCRVLQYSTLAVRWSSPRSQSICPSRSQYLVQHAWLRPELNTKSPSSLHVCVRKSVPGRTDSKHMMRYAC